MKTMRLITALFILLLTAMIINAETINLKSVSDSEQERTKSFSVNKGGKLYVNVNPGEIKISTWDKNEVVVKVRGLEEKELDNVSMTQSDNTVTVKYNPEWGWGDDAEFIITVPSQFNVEAKTSGGDISVNSDIAGNVDLSSMGGDLSLKNVKGDAKLSTQGGDVKVGNVSGSLSLNTMGGDITTGNVSGSSAKVSTMGGDITIGKVSSGISATTYGGDIKISGIGGNGDIETYGGNIDLKDVKGNVKMETKGGNISIDNAAGSIKAETYAGEIELYGISGSVDVKTMAGNITAELNPSAGSKSSLMTQSGEVELTLPGSVKADISAEIKTYGNWKYMKDVYSIDSDFPQINKKGDREKRISGEYSINGGGAKINIKTTNGNISIKKGSR